MNKKQVMKVCITALVLISVVYQCFHSTRKPRVVIIGSYKKCWAEMMEIHDQFTREGYNVLAPIKSVKIGDPNADFVLLKADGNKSKKELQDAVFKKIDSLNTTTDFIYVLNLRCCDSQDFGEYWTGHSTDFEFGYAHKAGKRIICANEPDTLNHKFYCEYPNKDWNKLN